MNIEQAIEKAQKLMRLAKSSNAHEAALAAQRAQEILTRYEIDRAALDVDAEAPAPVEPVGRSGDALDGGSRLPTWRMDLATGVAKANACRAFHSRDHQWGRTEIILVGRASDVAKVRYLYGTLVGEVERLTRKLAAGQGRRYVTAFREGCVAEIRASLQRAAAAVADEMRKQAAGDTAALVRLDRALARMDQRKRDVDAWVAAQMNVGTIHSGGSRDAVGYAAGQAAGRTVNVGGGRGQLALGAGARRLGN